jgi:hypothetical protein
MGHIVFPTAEFLAALRQRFAAVVLFLLLLPARTGKHLCFLEMQQNQ